MAGLGLLVMLTQGPEESAAKPVVPAAAPAPPAPEPRAHPPRSVDYALVDARLKRLIADPRMVGLAIGIVEDGQITYLRGYGATRFLSGEAFRNGQPSALAVDVMDFMDALKI